MREPRKKSNQNCREIRPASKELGAVGPSEIVLGLGRKSYHGKIHSWPREHARSGGSQQNEGTKECYSERSSDVLEKGGELMNESESMV